MDRIHSSKSASGADMVAAPHMSKRRSRLGQRYVYGSRPDDEAASADERQLLDPHHTHFVLVDGERHGSAASGGEDAVRSALEDAIASTCFGIDEDGDAFAAAAARGSGDDDAFLARGGQRGAGS